MLTDVKQFVKEHRDDIILLIGVTLISLLSFAGGYIIAKQQEKEPIRVEMHESSYCGCGDLRFISSLETFRIWPSSNSF